MRAIMATGLLLLQLRPMLAIAICQAQSGGVGARTEITCPMPETEAAAEDPLRHESGSSSALTLPDDIHQCRLAEFCLTMPPAVQAGQHALISPTTDSHLVIVRSGDVLRAANRTPPVPPPKA